MQSPKIGEVTLLSLQLHPRERRDGFTGRLLNKISLNDDGEIMWSMRKLQIFDFIKIKFAAGFNFKTKTPLWQYR